MKRKIFIIVAIISYFTLSGTESSGLFDKQYQDLMVSVSFAEPKIYRVNDMIFIDIKLTNRSNNTRSALIANDKRYSFDFELVSLQNKEVAHCEEYSNFFNRVQPIFNSMIRLEKDEGFTYRVLLNDYFNINMTGQYYLRCVFHPNLKLTNGTENTVKSNYLTINIRPEAILDKNITEVRDVEKEKKLMAEKKSPDEVVEYMLNSRMKGEWEKFFLYVDLDRMILTNSRFKERYLKADSERQVQLIEEYKNYMKQNTIDEISFLPVHFDIVKTEYSAGEAKVETIVKYKQYDFVEDKYYTYFLKKKDDIWFITSYTVLNIGVK